MIPEQLKKEEYRFIKVASKNKTPLEIKWQETANYKYNTLELIEHIQRGGNYGVCGGFGNLLIIDFDDQKIQDEKTKLLPKTFTTKSGRGMLHYYYETDNAKSWKITDEEKRTLVDFQGKGKQVIGANSTHPNGNKYQVIDNAPITFISEKDLKQVFNDYLIKYELPKVKPNHSFGEDKIRDEIKNKIKVPEILSGMGIDTNKNPTTCPFHDSKAGHCLGFNNDVWHCFHCEDKGDIFSLVMKKQNLSFPQAKKFLANKLGIKQELSNFPVAIKQTNEIINLNWLETAEDFIKTQPLYYDKNKVWWYWDFQNNKWCMVDETDILTQLDNLGEKKTTKNFVKQEALEALRRKARLNKPKPIKETWVQFKNKIVDIETNESFDVNPEYFATNPLPYDLSVSEETPMLDKVFKEWVGEKYVQTLYEILAFCMCNSYFIHRIFVLIGAGRNGKSSYQKIIAKFIGCDNVSTTDLDLVLNSRFERIKFYKKLVCEMGETNFNTMNKTSIIKRLSGQDMIGFELKGKNPFDDYNYAKIIISTNSLPATEDRTEGFYRRWVVIDFDNKFSEKEDVLKKIPEQEFKNLSLKCFKILRNLWVNREFTNEGSIEERMQRYEERSNPLKKFVDEMTILEPDGYIFKFELKEAFEKYCKGRGLRIWGDRELGLFMKDVCGFETRQFSPDWWSKEGEKPRWWAWVGLKWKGFAQDAQLARDFSLHSLYIENEMKKGVQAVQAVQFEQKLHKILALCQKDNAELLETIFGKLQIEAWIRNATIVQNPAGTYRLL